MSLFIDISLERSFEISIQKPIFFLLVKFDFFFYLLLHLRDVSIFFRNDCLSEFETVFILRNRKDVVFEFFHHGIFDDLLAYIDSARRAEILVFIVDILSFLYVSG